MTHMVRRVRGLGRAGTLATCIAVTACGATVQPSSDGDAGVDADLDAPDIDAELPLGPWGPPVPVDITPVGDDDPSATGDLLELYFNRSQDIFVTTRASTADPWGPPALVAELSSGSNDTNPEVSYDGLTIYLSSNRPGGLGGRDIWMSTRPSRAAPWSVPLHVPELSSAASDGSPTTTDQLVMVLESTRAGTNDVFYAERPSPAMPWGAPIRIDVVSTPDAGDGNPMLSADGLELYFDSNRTGDSELYLATRARADEPFSTPQIIPELASPGSNDGDMWISPDRRTLLFTSNRDGVSRLWQSTR
jgi:hypothetical protein